MAAENTPRMDDDARFELAMAAAARERRNRPRALLLGSGLLLAAAGTAAVLGLSARGTAQSFYRLQQIDAAQVERMVAEYRDLSGRQDVGPEMGPMPYIFSDLSALAQQAGLQQSIRPPTTFDNTMSGSLKSVEYRYVNVQDPSLEAILRWLLLAEQQIQGLEVYEIPSLKPLPNGNWQIDVTLRRWERIS